MRGPRGRERRPHLVGAERAPAPAGPDRRPPAGSSPPSRRSHWPRQGLRCQVTPAPLAPGAGALGPEPVAPSASHIWSAPFTWQARSSQTWTTAGGRRAGAEQGVERRHPVSLGRRDGEPGADVVERPGADPADPFLDRVQHRQQQVPPGPRGVAAVRGMPVGRRPLPAVPAGRRRARAREATAARSSSVAGVAAASRRSTSLHLRRPGCRCRRGASRRACPRGSPSP